MKWNHPALFVAAIAMLATTGCASHVYVAHAGPPPPAFQGPRSVVAVAERNGFADGREVGAREAYNRMPFAPRRARAFRDTPGYRPELGPFGPYKDAYRNAFERGYHEGYYRR